MLPNPFRPVRTTLLGLHAGAVLATHVMAGALLGALTVAALAGAAGSAMAKRASR